MVPEPEDLRWQPFPDSIEAHTGNLITATDAVDSILECRERNRRVLVRLVFKENELVPWASTFFARDV